MSAFSIPLSGLAASSSSLNVIANNLANLNTDGYKSETLSFADIFNQAQGTSGNGDPIQIGSGVQTGETTSNFSNGGVSATGSSSNMALQGNGFFIVQQNGQTEYTRDGNFTTNNAGQIVTASGQTVMGYPAVNGVVSTNGALQPISVNSATTIPGVATTSFSMNTNLDSSAASGTTYSEPITMYDSLGASHQMTVTFTNNGGNSWGYSISLPAADTGGTGAPTVLATGTLTFNTSGQLTAPTGSITGINVTGLADGAANMSVSWNLNGSGTTPTITQLASASTTASTDPNGYGVGTLSGYTIEADGTVEGQFSNNQTLALGQVAVATFSNNQGLAQVGDNNFQSTIASGSAVIGIAGAGGNGTITGGSVEGSNVDLSTQFADMIVAQQGYEANAKVLTTLDQVSQATLQMVQG